MTHSSETEFVWDGPNGKVVALGILVICPVDKNHDSKTKNWLWAPNIQILGSKLYIFVPSGLLVGRLVVVVRGLYLARHLVTLWIWLVEEEEQQGRQMLTRSTKIGQGSNKTWQPARTLLFLNAHTIYIFWLVGGRRRSRHSFWKDHTFVLPISFTFAVWFISAVGQVAILIIFCQFFGVT